MKAKLPKKALVHLAEADPRLGAVIERVGPFRMELSSEQSHLFALLRAIVYQQLSGKAAATIFGRVEALFPPASFPDPKRILAASDEALRGAGLSRGKLAAIRDLCEKAESLRLHELDRATDDEVTERLVRVRGIGPWSAQMFLMFHLGRPDVWPATDLGIRKGAGLVLGRKSLPAVSSVEKWGERFRPWRSAAAWYLWRALE